MPGSLPWRFLLMFGAIYMALYVAYTMLPERLVADQLFYYGITRPTQELVNWLAPPEHVLALRNRLQSTRATLIIVRGCDGAGVVFLLIAAIIAYRARLLPTVLGVGGAAALVYLLNEMRIVALYFVQAYRPVWFMTVHVYLIPSLMVLIGTIYFAAWSTRCRHGTGRPSEA